MIHLGYCCFFWNATDDTVLPVFPPKVKVWCFILELFESEYLAWWIAGSLDALVCQACFRGETFFDLILSEIASWFPLSVSTLAPLPGD